MENLMHLIDTSTSGFTPFALDIVAFISVLFSISVIIIKNPISSVLSLIALFFSIACYLIMLCLTFIGLSYLLIYVGAVSILFLFILMLINVRVSELSTNTSNSIPLVILVAIFFIYAFDKVLPTDFASISVITYMYKAIIPLMNYFVYFMDSSLNLDINYESDEMHFVTSNS